MLSEQSFFRIHKSYVVNLKHIRNIFKDTVTLENGEDRHRSKELRQQFLSYMKENI